MRITPYILMVLAAMPMRAAATSYYVATWGDDGNPGTFDVPWATIQKAANTLHAGDTVFVRGGVYHEKIVINVSGSDGSYIVFTSYPGETAVIDGTGVSGEHMIYMSGRDYIKIEGFQIRNNRGGSGIFVEDSGDYIVLKDNEIYNMQGPDGMGITVYAHVNDSVTHIRIEGNEIHDCEPARSEALVVNGDVFDFEILNNIVHDVNNIGIDAIGGEVPGKVAKRGIIRGNVVYRAHSSYGGGYAAGIYIDGARNVRVEQNMVYECDMGIEVGCENAGYVAESCTVRANILYHNDKAGLAFGGYEQSVGRVEHCVFMNNTLYRNQVVGDGEGEVWIQFASNNIFENNIIYAGEQGILLTSWEGNEDNVLDYNCWLPYEEPHSDMFVWNGESYSTFEEYRTATGQDQHSIKTDPMFLDTSTLDFHLQPSSPCIDAGDPGTPSGFDFEGNPVPLDGDQDGDTVADIGAYEFVPSGGINETQPAYRSEIYMSFEASNSLLHIEFSGIESSGRAALQIFNITGRLVKQLDIGNMNPADHSFEVDVSDLKSGIYICRLRLGERAFERKVILIR